QIRNSAYITADYNATATASLMDGLTSSTSVGAQYYRRRTDWNSISADEFPAPGVRTAAAAARVTGSQDYVTNSTLGTFAQQQFGWRDRLFVTGAVRVDNNSAFGNDVEFVTYPKLSGTWVVSDEPFWSFGPVEQLRLRAAYGASGQQPNAFAALRTFEPATGTGDLPIVVPQSVGNPELKPERGEELEVGFDLDMLGRLGFEFTYYTRKVKDAILERSIAPSSGFSGVQYVNIGEVANSGLELQLNLQALSREDVRWDLAFSYATADDEITDLGGIASIQVGLPTQAHVEGYPIGGFWTKRITSAEVTEAGQAVNVLCDDGSGGVVACADAPRVYMGTPTPTYNGAFSSTVTLWDRLQLHGMVDFKGGHQLFNSNDFVRCALLGVCEANVLPQEADPVYLASAQIGGDFSAVSPFIENGTYAKLREISATYTVPERFAGYIGASGASLTVAGRNLHTWTDYSGLDPESRAFLDNAVSSNDQGVLPVMPQFVTSLRLTF
ncbi:MAG TPA: TonB-dependent receptor, partial [Longimicrobiales bacterium]|nr:TonB-dependent receptor [Longimicrobiales bacterium]